MNEVIKIGNQFTIKYVESDSGKTECLINDVIIDRYSILSKAINAETRDDAYMYLGVANYLFSPLNDSTFDTMRFAACIVVRDKFYDIGEKNEFYYQKLFKEYYSSIRSGKVIDFMNNGKDIPDAWVLDGNELIPVEVKKDKFNGSALNQLERYMRVYKSKRGIAVAKFASVKLPKNVDMVFISDLEKAREAVSSCSS